MYIPTCLYVITAAKEENDQICPSESKLWLPSAAKRFCLPAPVRTEGNSSTKHSFPHINRMRRFELHHGKENEQ